MRFLRINSNERVLEKPTGSANTVEDGSGIGKSWEGEGDEAFTDDVGVKLADVERGLASSEEIYIYFIYSVILFFNVKYYYLPSEILIFKKIQNKKTSTCKLQLKMEGMCESGGQEIFILSFTFIYSNKDFAFL